MADGSVGSFYAAAVPGEPRLTATVLSYDGRALLEVVLPSLAAQTLSAFRTVVVDNGSRDDTLGYLRECWPEVEVVALPQNVGVTAALNACLRSSRTEYTCLLNNDLELHPECLAELVAALDEHAGAGSATAKLLDFDERGVIDGAGDLFVWQGLPIRRGWGEPDRGQFDEPGPVFGACGAVAVYRRAAIEAVGDFDETYFACYEDADWAFRAQLAGFACRYVPSAVAFHMGSVTVGAVTTDFTRFQLWRNGVWLVAKNYPAPVLLREAPRLAFCQGRNLFVAVRERRFGVWRRAMTAALRGLPAALGRRRGVQRRRTRSLRELDAIVGFDT